MCRFLNPLLFARRAFTLVELIVVIVILGILMAIAVPAFMSMRDRGNDTSAISNLNVAYRTVAGFAAGGDIYAASPADLAAKLGASEPGMPTPVVAPNDPAVGAIQVNLHDEERTAHLCTVSATGTSFCLAMNSLGQLETNSPFVSSRTVYRTWGRSLAAAACWLPTEEDGPGESCDAPTRALGGEGTKPAGGGDPGDLGELPAEEVTEDTADTIPVAGFVGAPGASPDVADVDVSANPVTRVLLRLWSGTPTDGAFGTATIGYTADHLTTTETGDVYFWDGVLRALRVMNVTTQQVQTVVPRIVLPAPTVGDDLPIAEASFGSIEGMGWGGGRLWMIDYHPNDTANMYVRVFNPNTGRIATVSSHPRPGPGKFDLAYVPSEGALYFGFKDVCTTSADRSIKRLKVNSKALTSVTLPDDWAACSMRYDHVSKNLVMLASKTTPAPGATYLSGVFAYTPTSNSLELLAGGVANSYTLTHLTETTIGYNPGGVINVTANGDIILTERGAKISASGVSGTLVRKVDRDAGTLNMIYHRGGTDRYDVGATTVAIGGDGRVYYPTYEANIAAASLLP